MKKPKVSLGPDGFKGLMIQHVEKIVFGVAVVVVVLFVYLGASLESFETNKTPDRLQNLATEAVAHVNATKPEILQAERIPRDGKGGQFEYRVQERGVSTDPGVYALTVPLDPPSGRPGSKREDPQLLKPIKLETGTVIGAICVNGGDDRVGPLEDLEFAEAKDKPKKRAKKKRRSGSSGSPYGSGGEDDENPYGGDDEGDEFGSGLTGGDSPDSGGSSRNRRNKKDEPPKPERQYPADKVCGYRPGGVSSGAYDDPGGFGSGDDMPGLGSPGAGGSGGAGMLGDPSGGGAGMLGGPGGPGGSGGIPGMGGSSAGSATAIAEQRQMIVVKALLPYRKQADEFERVLGEAIGYDPVRDRPRLVFFQAQRVDVTADPTKEPEEKDWKSIMNPTHAKRIADREKWHGFLKEVADPMYVDPVITMPAPPMMLRCLEDVMNHSEIPKRSALPKVESPTSDPDEDSDLNTDPGSDQPGGDLPGGLAGAGPGTSGYPGSGGSPYGSGSDYPSEDDGMEGYGSGDDFGDPGAGYGSSGEGDFGMPGYGSSSASPAETVQYKLIRFFDDQVQPGHVYRYRVRVYLEDPNNPNSDPANGVVRVAPRRRTLSSDVLDRIKAQKADDATKDSYYVISDWSDTTDPVSLPSSSQLYVGNVKPALRGRSINKTTYVQSEPRGQIAPVVWDSKLVTDVSFDAKVIRGSVMRLRDDFPILDPVTLYLRRVKDYELKNDFLVLDLDGGESLPGDRESRVTSAGEFALIDDQGNFIVRNELDDSTKYRRYSLADAKNVGSGGSEFGDFGSGGGPGGMGGSGGMGDGGEMPGLGSPAGG